MFFRTLCRVIRYRLTKCLAFAYLHAQQDMIMSWERWNTFNVISRTDPTSHNSGSWQTACSWVILQNPTSTLAPKKFLALYVTWLSITEVHNSPPPPEHIPHPRVPCLKMSTLILLFLLRVGFTKRLFTFQYQDFLRLYEKPRSCYMSAYPWFCNWLSNSWACKCALWTIAQLISRKADKQEKNSL